jgi:MFS family permease
MYHELRKRGTSADSAYAWLRLVAAILLATIGGVGMWSFPVALPAIQADFSIIRADASLPFTLAMLGFAAGGAAMGWLLDRFGILVPLSCGAVALAIG